MLRIAIYGSHTVTCYCNVFPDVMLTGPGVMDIYTKVYKRLDDFNVVSRHWHKGAQRGRSISTLDLGLRLPVIWYVRSETWL